MARPNYKLRRLAVLFLVFAGFFLVGNLLAGFFTQSSVVKKVEKGKPVNILVMGIDARNAEQNSRSDTMIVASIDRKTKQVVMVWIPRDTRVQVSANRYDKINSVNVLKGPEEACKVAGKLLDTRIDYYVITNFGGFEKIIDILGGVNIDVETAMTHYDPNPKLSINLSSGPQRLNGAQALSYVRYRGGPTADIGRTVRQQKFVSALAQEMFRPSIITKLPELVPELSKHIHTNIPASDMLFMMQVAREFDVSGIVTQTLPGYPFTDPKTGASYWEADADIAKGILDDLFAGKTYDVAQDPPHWVQPAKEPVTNEMLEEEVPPEVTEDPSEVVDTEAGTGPEGYVTEPGDQSEEEEEGVTEGDADAETPETETPPAESGLGEDLPAPDPETQIPSPIE
ncbi:MAG: LCP family protein [Bacillota bacterium]|jgi:LCP family protein required for cell wall assembly|nr:LCP family protein [Bacillota bacterium]